MHLLGIINNDSLIKTYHLINLHFTIIYQNLMLKLCYFCNHFFLDMEHCHQQADIPELLQDEDVCCPGSHPHAVWSHSQSFQPPVRFFSSLFKLALTFVFPSV